MKGRRGGVALAVLSMACAVCCGCTGGEGSAVPSTESDAGLPTEVAARETTRSPLHYREYELPPGGDVGGYADRTVCLLEPVSVDSGELAIRVLDLETGGHEIVVPNAAGAEAGLVVISARCSDEWLVWEEIGGEEQFHPLEVQWRLYALRIGADAGTTPVVVAEAVTASESRPLYSVSDSTVYWMTNSFANEEDVTAEDQSRLWKRELPGGDAELVYRTVADTFSFSAQGDELLLSEAVERNAEEGKLVVIDAVTGEVREEFEYGNTSWLSHYAAYSDGMLAWAEGTDLGIAGHFYFRDAEGAVSLVAENANDAVFVGDYLVFEAKEEDVGPDGPGLWWRVCAMDTKTLEYFVLYEEFDQVLGWVAPIGVAPRANGYLMYKSVPPWITETEPGTWVRMYDLE